jgi:hypothetical protein
MDQGQISKPVKQGVVARPHLGMKLYEIDMVTRLCRPVEVLASTKQLFAKPHPELIKTQNDLVRQERHHKVVNDSSKFYTWAINEKNAMKKFEQRHGRFKS